MIPAGLPMRRADGAIMYRAVDGDVFTGDEPYHRWIDAVRHAQVVQEFRRQGLWDEVAGYKQPWLEYRHGPGWTLAVEVSDASRSGLPAGFRWPQARPFISAPDWWRDEWGRAPGCDAWSGPLPARRLPDGTTLIDAYVSCDGGWMISTWPIGEDDAYLAEMADCYPDMPKKLLQPWRYGNVIRRLRGGVPFSEDDAWYEGWHRYAVERLPTWPLLSEQFRSREGK